MAESLSETPSRGSRLRDLSRRLVLEELERAAPLSQAELVRATGLSRATVASIITELRQSGRVETAGAQRAPTRGRPGTLLMLAPGDNVVAGVDFGHSHVAVALARLDGTIITERRETMDVHHAAEESLDHAAALLSTLMAESALPRPPVMIGVGVPGPVEVRTAEGATGRVCAGTVLPSWAGYDPAAEMSARSGLPAIAENDANLGALGESRYGIGHAVSDLVFVKVSSGIGTGMILDGRLYRGARGTSGEIGHVQVRADGALCRCGSRGCLETVSSADAALALLTPAHGRAMHAEDLFALEAAGDPGVLRLLTDMGAAIGQVIAVVVANLDPELVVVGGAMALPALVASVESSIQRYNQPYVAAEIQVRSASLGERASLMGAIAIAIDAAP